MVSDHEHVTEEPVALPISNGMSRAQYITTTLPYVNAEPHIGFALEIVHADIYARYRMLLGDDVFFNTGTDEHGQKIFEAARKSGKEPAVYADEYAAKFRALKDALGLSPELHFIRTTDPHHVAAAQEMWRRCEKDIYQKTYTGLYCVGCEAFKTEKEIENGRCSLHPSHELREVSERNYFFKLSKYQEDLRKYLSKPGVILPEWRQHEALQFVEAGLEDISISREKKSGLNEWGIPVSGDDSQTMYVWFDALANYISTLGWPEDAEGLFKKFWEEGDTLQLAGKDQVRFQSIIWQAMLMSAGLPTTKQIVYHGFITSGGQKMSKSIGNVIDPLIIVGEYGTDALRYFLARHISPFEDTDVTMEAFKAAYNAGLANGIGNTTARIMKMAQEHLPSPIDIPSSPTWPEEFETALDAYEIQSACEMIGERLSALDAKIQETKPFSLVKTDKDAALIIIRDLAVELYKVARMLNPIIPVTSEKIKKAIKENKMPEIMFSRKE